MKKRSLFTLLSIFTLLATSAQTPFVKGKVIDQQISEMTFVEDSVQMKFSEDRLLKASKSDVLVSFASLNVLECKGWHESAYIKFSLIPGATSYHVYIKGGRLQTYQLIDQQLVRNYGTYGRADAVGLTAADDYQFKIVPVDIEGTEMLSAVVESQMLHVVPYDRSGFAHFNYNSGVGAYNNDGSLKDGAAVIYVTASTAKTVKATLSSGEFIGLQAILAAYEKGNVTTPLAVRVIGTVKASDVDEFGSKEEGIQIKGRKADSELNITIEGIGDDATIHGFGFLCRNTQSVEFRNFAIMRCMDDGISLDTDNSNIWMHHIDVYYGKHGSGDHAKGDGAIDVKTNSKYITLSYCHFWDTGKSNMFGMKSEKGPNYITYHHNWFDHSDSRHPRIRTMSVHVYNNYFDGNSKYGVGVTTGASCFVENNYFRHAHNPMLSSKQGTDAKGSGTFSGEDGGIIKSFGNIYAETGGSSYYRPITYQENQSSFDCYEATERNEQVPATIITLAGSTLYDNFDTQADLMYSYTPDHAEDVPTVVMGFLGAGRLNHGDCQFHFDNSVDDTSYDVNSGLEKLIDGYKSSLLGVFGEKIEITDDGEKEDTTHHADMPEGTIFCTFDKSGTPSNTFFHVTGNGSNSKGTATVDGVVYSTCLKMESSTSIKFTLTKTMTLSLYFADTETASIKINGTKIVGVGSVYTTVLESGDYELTKDKSVNLFAIKLEPVDEE